MKRSKNIEGKNEQQLDAIKDQDEKQPDALESHRATNKSHKIEFDNNENQEAKKLVDEVDRMSIENKRKNALCLHSNGKDVYYFNEFRDIRQFGNNIFNVYVSIKQEKDEQNKMESYKITIQPVSTE